MTTSNAKINTLANGYTFLKFFNSKEMYSLKGFDTKRKALNYAKKYSINIFDAFPENIDTVSYLYN